MATAGTGHKATIQEKLGRLFGALSEVVSANYNPTVGRVNGNILQIQAVYGYALLLLHLVAAPVTEFEDSSQLTISLSGLDRPALHRFTNETLAISGLVISLLALLAMLRCAYTYHADIARGIAEKELRGVSPLSHSADGVLGSIHRLYAQFVGVRLPFIAGTLSILFQLAGFAVFLRFARVPPDYNYYLSAVVIKGISVLCQVTSFALLLIFVVALCMKRHDPMKEMHKRLTAQEGGRALSDRVYQRGSGDATQNAGRFMFHNARAAENTSSRNEASHGLLLTGMADAMEASTGLEQHDGTLVPLDGGRGKILPADIEAAARENEHFINSRSHLARGHTVYVVIIMTIVLLGIQSRELVVTVYTTLTGVIDAEEEHRVLAVILLIEGAAVVLATLLYLVAMSIALRGRNKKGYAYFVDVGQKIDDSAAVYRTTCEYIKDHSHDGYSPGVLQTANTTLESTDKDHPSFVTRLTQHIPNQRGPSYLYCTLVAMAGLSRVCHGLVYYLCTEFEESNTRTCAAFTQYGAFMLGVVFLILILIPQFGILKLLAVLGQEYNHIRLTDAINHAQTYETNHPGIPALVAANGIAVGGVANQFKALALLAYKALYAHVPYTSRFNLSRVDSLSVDPSASDPAVVYDRATESQDKKSPSVTLRNRNRLVERVLSDNIVKSSILANAFVPQSSMRIAGSPQ